MKRKEFEKASKLIKDIEKIQDAIDCWDEAKNSLFDSKEYNEKAIRAICDSFPEMRECMVSCMEENKEALAELFEDEQPDNVNS